MTARSVLVAGTASHVGKSTVAAGLCRLLADRGVDVAPFKAQNMSNNARAVPRANTGAKGRRDGDPDTPTAFGEIGVSQYVQAHAARVHPTTHHNPVLLKPRGDGESQLVLDGEAVGHFAAGQYYEDHWDDALATAKAAYDRLAAEHDVIVMEGAGSIAEINLHHRDLSNVALPRYADADVVLVADIERGGVFASLVGTLELMPDDLRENVVGAIVTKFRGDVSLLDPGLEAFEEKTSVPILGVLPYDDPGLPEEDSVALPDEGETRVLGADDGAPDEHTITVAVPRFPRISNATDLEPLARTPGVRVRYQALDESLVGADAVVLPGTKNTVDDLHAARDAGFHRELRDFEGPVVGLCGGYQMLGERIVDAAGLEGTGARRTDVAVDDGVDGDGGGAAVVDGFALLPVETSFHPAKTVVAVERTLAPTPVLGGVTGSVSGYEIHAGETRHLDDVDRPFTDGDGATTDRVLGTYLHGLFENSVARRGFLDAVYDAAGRTRPEPTTSVSDPFDAAASLVADHVDPEFVTEMQRVQTRKP